MEPLPRHPISSSSFPMLMAVKGQACRGSPWAGTALVPSHLKSWLKDTNLNGMRIPIKTMSLINLTRSLQRGHWKQ